MRLYVMRHGPAEESSRSGRDFDRELSAAGRARTEAVALELGRRRETPARIISSPLVRALQTADIVRSVLGGSIEVRDELAPSEAAPGIVGELLRAGSSALLVGHAPDVSLLVTELLGRPWSGFEPAMVVALDVSDVSSRRGAAEAFVIRPSK